jgi:hypothetical protein
VSIAIITNAFAQRAAGYFRCFAFRAVTVAKTAAQRQVAETKIPLNTC